MDNKKNKAVFLTGATKGLGKLLAESFHREGYSVIGTDLYPAEDIPAEISSLLKGYYSFDLSETEKIGHLVNKITERHKIDVLVNNAAILNFRFLKEYQDSEIEKTIKVNLISAILLVKSFMPHFVENRYGRIINISSSSSFRGFETGTVYTSSKAGVNLFKESFHRELRILKKKTNVDITINNVCPSRIHTEEYITENPGVDPKSLIEPDRVFSAIQKLVEGNLSGRMVTIFDAKFRKKLFIKDFRRFLKIHFLSVFS
jgi:NAD(P)-dependent dehydrogenase (short-subunit alcohol dehydrogenase family)